jgi:hypothetical protein
MSVETLAVCLHHSKASGTAKLVLIGIANHDGDGGSWPSIATLARYANVTPRNVQKAITKLVSMGEVVVDPQQGGLRDTPDEERTNLFHVRVVCPQWCDGSTRHRDTRSRQGTLTPPPQPVDNPLSQTPPPVDSDTPPLSQTTPPPLSHATPEPSIEPATKGGLDPTVSTGPAPSCDICSQDMATCIRRQHTSGHTYRPAGHHRIGSRCTIPDCQRLHDQAPDQEASSA